MVPVSINHLHIWIFSHGWYSHLQSLFTVIWTPTRYQPLSPSLPLSHFMHTHLQETDVHIHAHVRVAYASAHTYIHIPTPTPICANIHTRTHTHIYIHMHIYTHIHIHIDIYTQPCSNKWYEHQPQPVTENENAKLLWDYSIKRRVPNLTVQRPNRVM